MQSSTWSNYKHHNTAKVLIGCTPNGVVTFVSKLYVGSISDVELTSISGYLSTLDGEDGVSVMADRGFTIRDLLKEKNISLNIPPFLEGRKQLSAQDIKDGHGIASLRIPNQTLLYFEGNSAHFNDADQIVSVCAWLTNFNTALIPVPCDLSTEDEYFQSIDTD